MTDEEKQAIEFLSFYKEHCLKIETENMKNGNYETVNDEGFVYKNLETVLNLIEKQQAEIRQYDKALHDQIIKDYDMELELKAEIEKKDKIIDKYISYIWTYDLNESKEWIKNYIENEWEEK